MVGPKRGDLLFNWSCEARGCQNKKLSFFFLCQKSEAKVKVSTFSSNISNFPLIIPSKKCRWEEPLPQALCPWSTSPESSSTGADGPECSAAEQTQSWCIRFFIWYDMFIYIIYTYWYDDMIIKSIFNISMIYQNLQTISGLGTAATPRDIVWTFRTGGGWRRLVGVWLKLRHLKVEKWKGKDEGKEHFSNLFLTVITCDFGVSNRSCWIEVIVHLVTLYVSLVTRLPFALSEARTSILESIQNFLFPWNINMKVPFQVWKQMIYIHATKINFEEPFLVFQKQIPSMTTTGSIHWTKRSVRKALTLFEHVEEDPMSSSLMSRMKSQWCQWDGVMGCSVLLIGETWDSWANMCEKMENWSDFFVVICFNGIFIYYIEEKYENREFLAKELVLMKQMMLWKPELLILMVAMMKMKQNVEKRHQTKSWKMRKKSCGKFTTPNWKVFKFEESPQKSGCFCWFCRLAPGEAVSSGTMTWASSRATNVHEVNARNTKPMKARSDGKKNKWNLLCKHCWLPSWWRFIIFMIGHPSACFTPMQTILRSFEA